MSEDDVREDDENMEDFFFDVKKRRAKRAKKEAKR